MESYSTNFTNQTHLYYGYSFEVFNSVDRPIFILLDIYSKLIKPITKVSDISFYRLNKNNTNYIFKTKNFTQ